MQAQIRRAAGVQLCDGFQSLIHQGKNASISPAKVSTASGILFQSLIHQGKNASYASRRNADQIVLEFQSLIHQGKNARHITQPQKAGDSQGGVSIPYSSGEKCKR